MRSASSISAGDPSVRWMLMPQPDRAQIARIASRWAASRAEISVAQALRPRREHAQGAGGIEKLSVAGERIGLLDRIDDHHQFAERPLRAHRLDCARDVSGSERKSPIKRTIERGAAGSAGGNGGLRGAPESLVGRDRLGEALDDALRRQGSREAEQTGALAAAHAQIGESERQQRGPVDLRRRRQTRARIASTASGRTRSRPYAPLPIRARARRRAPRAPSDASRRATTARRRERAEIARRFRPSRRAAGHERRAARSARRGGPR